MDIKDNYESGISVIIPVYNAEKYVESLLQSINKQTFSDYEVLLIDDGSVDNSCNICTSYCDKDKRIQYFYIKNSGVSNARNTGILLSKKKYILFLDADDYIEKDMFKELYIFAETNKCDISICGYSMEYYHNDLLRKKYDFKVNENIIYRSNVFCEELWQNSLMYNVWNRLIKREIIIQNKILFPEYNMGEDLEFNLCTLYVSNNVGAINKVLYHYIREREGAATSKRYIKDWFNIRKLENVRLWNHFDKIGYLNSKEAKEFLACRYIERVLGCFENEFNKSNKITGIQKYRNIKTMIKDVDLQKSIKMCKSQSKKLKILTFFIKHKMSLICFIFGFFVSTIRQYLPELFFKLKVER